VFEHLEIGDEAAMAIDWRRRIFICYSASGIYSRAYKTSNLVS
jgi:hypothetical protein